MKKKRPPRITEDLHVLFGLEAPQLKSKRKSAPKNQPTLENAEQGLDLWQSITRAIMPLKSRSKFVSPAQKKPVLLPALVQKVPILEKSRLETAPLPVPDAAANQHNNSVPHGMGRDILRDLSRGKRKIRNRIDLHGMQQDAAHIQLKHFLIAAQSREERVVLVITGKGRNSGQDTANLLRRLVPLWLESAAFRPLVISHHAAHIQHGGNGALYVHLRRKTEISA